ncbi:MAG: hypothetical protein ABEH35_07800 [Haloarculaceae archaeon]
MATSAYLASTALMAVVVVGVVLWAARGRQWYRYSPSTADEGWYRTDAETSGFAATLGETRTWILAFLVASVVAVGGVLTYVTTAPPGQTSVGLGVAVIFGVLLGGYLIVGVYSSARRRGHPSSIAAAETATVVGALFLVAIALQLVVG